MCMCFPYVYTIAWQYIHVNTFFTTFCIFIIHNLLTEMRLTFSIFREPYFLTEFFDRVSSYYNVFFLHEKKRRATALPHVDHFNIQFCFIFHSKILKLVPFFAIHVKIMLNSDTYARKPA